LRNSDLSAGRCAARVFRCGALQPPALQYSRPAVCIDVREYFELSWSFCCVYISHVEKCLRCTSATCPAAHRRRGVCTTISLHGPWSWRNDMYNFCMKHGLFVCGMCIEHTEHIEIFIYILCIYVACMYIYMCTYMYTYLYIYMYTYMYTYMLRCTAITCRVVPASCCVYKGV